MTAADVHTLGITQRGDAPLLLDVKSVAWTLGIGVRSVWRLTSAGELPAPISVGRSKRWERRTIEAYVAAKMAARKPRNSI